MSSKGIMHRKYAGKTKDKVGVREKLSTQMHCAQVQLGTLQQNQPAEAEMRKWEVRVLTQKQNKLGMERCYILQSELNTLNEKKNPSGLQNQMVFFLGDKNYLQTRSDFQEPFRIQTSVKSGRDRLSKSHQNNCINLSYSPLPCLFTGAL